MMALFGITSNFKTKSQVLRVFLLNIQIKYLPHWHMCYIHIFHKTLNSLLQGHTSFSKGIIVTHDRKVQIGNNSIKTDLSSETRSRRRSSENDASDEHLLRPLRVIYPEDLSSVGNQVRQDVVEGKGNGLMTLI